MLDVEFASFQTVRRRVKTWIRFSTKNEETQATEDQLGHTNLSEMK